MTEAGLWHRPWYFAREGESLSDAYIRETTTARECVALCDVTSLGKIAIQGPDATELLVRQAAEQGRGRCGGRSRQRLRDVLHA